MAVESDLPVQQKPSSRIVYRQSGGDAVYGIGVIGALVYYLSHATDFKSGALGVFKALFWPAYMVYKVIELLKM